jgi:hypothetical protein
LRSRNTKENFTTILRIMTDKAFITPYVLKWARESARISEKTAADKVPVSVEKLKERIIPDGSI